MISIAQADQQQKQAEAQAEQANVIIDAIKLLSQQIDDMRAELVSRLTQIDNTLAVNFGQQHSLLDAIVKNQNNQAEELALIAASLRKSHDELRETLDAYAERQREVLWAECLSMPVTKKAQDETLLRRRKINAQFMATRWSYTRNISIAPDFETAFPLNPVESVPLFEFAKVIPLYGQVRLGQEFHMQNRLAWSWGAELMDYLLLNHPDTLTITSDDDMKELIGHGRLVQQFFRRVFADKGGRPDTTIVTDLAKAYQQLLDMYIDQLALKIVELQLPLSSVTDPLPEEYTPDKIKPVVAKAKSAPTTYDGPTMLRKLPRDKPWSADVVNYSETPRVADNRYDFNDELSKQRFSFLTKMLRGCPGYALKRDYGTEWDRVNVNQNLSSQFDVVNTTGVPVDASILKLMPREALWMEHLDASRFHVGACISELTFFSYYLDDQNPDLSNAIRWGFRMTIRFFLSDLKSGGDVWIGSAQTRVRIYTPTHIPRDLPAIFRPIFMPTWSGAILLGERVGPIVGHFDDFFAPNNATEEEIKALGQIQRGVEELRDAAIDNFRKNERIGDVNATKQKATQGLQILKGLRFLNYGNLPRD